MSTARFKPGVSLTLSRFLNGLMILNFTIKLCNSLHIDPYLEADNIRKVSQNPRENFKMRKILGENAIFGSRILSQILKSIGFLTKWPPKEPAERKKKNSKKC